MGPFAPDAFMTGFASFNFDDAPYGAVRGIPDSLSVSYTSEPESIWIMLIGISYLILFPRTIGRQRPSVGYRAFPTAELFDQARNTDSPEP